MRRDSDGRLHLPVREIQQPVPSKARRSVDALPRKLAHQRSRFRVAETDSDDCALISTPVEHASTGNSRKFLPQSSGKRERTLLRNIDPDVRCIARSCTESEHERIWKFPVLVSRRTRSELVAIRGDPLRATHVHEERMISARQRPVGSVKKASAPRSAQELPRGRRQIITLETLDIDRHLPNRLTRIDQVRNAELFANLANTLGILNDSRMRWNPGHVNEPASPITREGTHGLRIHSSLGEIGRVPDLHAVPLSQREESDLI